MNRTMIKILVLFIITIMLVFVVGTAIASIAINSEINKLEQEVKTMKSKNNEIMKEFESEIEELRNEIKPVS